MTTPPRAYYNEFDPKAAVWLRELIKSGLIADGDVDERSIEDVRPEDLKGYTQCHFFAGVGVWSYALRAAGVPDDASVWTGSCPCQPFSAAGKGAGVDDLRHLWPAWQHLIRECKPPLIFGEQVEAAIKHGWLDLVQSDLEGEGYAFAPVGIPAAGVGAPHIRQRLYFVAENTLGNPPHGGYTKRELGDQASAQRGAFACGEDEGRGRHDSANDGGASQLAYTKRDQEHQKQRRSPEDERGGGTDEFSGCGLVDTGTATRPTNGHWRDADWLFCRDGSWRPVEPGTFPLAHGAAARVGRLRGYGNAIVAKVAQTFIETYLEIDRRN